MAECGLFFFFQAEDGIRDGRVTGVQTCALPISLADEFSRMLQEMQIGRGRTEALRSMAERTNLPDLRGFVSAMVQADAFGIPIGQVLRVQSSEIRVKKRQWAEEQAQKVPVKILVPLVFCILPCLFIAVLGPAGITIMDSFRGRI